MDYEEAKEIVERHKWLNSIPLSITPCNREGEYETVPRWKLQQAMEVVDRHERSERDEYW